MEKPGPMLDRLPNYDRSHAADDDRAPYADRFLYRNVTILRDTDENVPKKPVWRGDHTFNSDAASYSLTHFIEPEVAREHKDWDLNKIKQEARERFTKRITQDYSYEQKESQHEETVVSWQKVETSDGVFELATEYGGKLVTLRELWDHTKEYAEFVGNSSAYNEQEARAQFAMQDAFIEGSASGFVSVLSHPDSIRYVQVWEQTDNGDITSKQVDLYKATGKDFSLSESQQLITHLASFHKELAVTDFSDNGSYAHFFVEHSAINEHAIRMIAMGVAMQKTEGNTRRENDVEVAYSVAKDATDSMVLLGKFLHETIEEKLRIFSGEKISENIQKKHIHLSDREAGSNHTRDTQAKTLVEMVGNQRDRANISRTDPVTDMMAEWFMSKSVLGAAEHLPVGAQGALLWLTKSETTPRDAITRSIMRADEGSGELPRVQIEMRESRVSIVKHVLKRYVASVRSFLRLDGLPRFIVTTPVHEKLRSPVKWMPDFRAFVRSVAVRMLALKEDHTVRKAIKKADIIARAAPETESIRAMSRRILIGISLWTRMAERRASVGRMPRRFFETIRKFIRTTDQTPHTRANDSTKEESGAVSTDIPGEGVWLLLGIIRYLVLLRESPHASTTQITVVPSVRSVRKKRAGRAGLIFPFSIMARSVIFTLAS